MVIYEFGEEKLSNELLKEREWWNLLDEDIQEKIVKYLVEFIEPADDADILIEAIEENPDSWPTDNRINAPYAPFHFGAGMAIRNYLRDMVGPDSILPHVPNYPDGNWDNFYTVGVEKAVQFIINERNNI